MCIDHATPLIPLWLVGPSPDAAVMVVAAEIEARGTPAIVSLHGVADRPWTARDIAALAFDIDARASA